MNSQVLGKQQGYYIYYEKNEKMKKYVKNLKNSATNSGIANNEIKNISVDDRIRRRRIKKIRNHLRRNWRT